MEEIQMNLDREKSPGTVMPRTPIRFEEPELSPAQVRFGSVRVVDNEPLWSTELESFIESETFFPERRGPAASRFVVSSTVVFRRPTEGVPSKKEYLRAVSTLVVEKASLIGVGVRGRSHLGRVSPAQQLVTWEASASSISNLEITQDSEGADVVLIDLGEVETSQIRLADPRGFDGESWNKVELEELMATLRRSVSSQAGSVAEAAIGDAQIDSGSPSETRFIRPSRTEVSYRNEPDSVSRSSRNIGQPEGRVALSPKGSSAASMTREERRNGMNRSDQSASLQAAEWARRSPVVADYLETMRKFSDFSGRATRKEYLMFGFMNVVIMVALSLILGSIGSLVAGVFMLATAVPAVAAMVRRLHDTGRSGATALLTLIPFIGGLILFVLLCQEGEANANRYGPNPKATSDGVQSEAARQLTTA
jgi:uncharacterized membrane protein YhaH (DUF805 family)